MFASTRVPKSEVMGPTMTLHPESVRMLEELAPEALQLEASLLQQITSQDGNRLSLGQTSITLARSKGYHIVQLSNLSSRSQVHVRL